MKITKHHVDYIRRDLRRRGIVDQALSDELVDHACCEVEQLTSEGIEFKQAYETFLKGLTRSHFRELQHHVIESENFNTTMLLKNNLKIMFRNMKKNMSFTLINVGGLTIGLLAFSAIALYVSQELNFDSQFARSSSIYRITMSTNVGGQTNHTPTSYPTLGPLLKDGSPAVKGFVRIINYKYSRLTPTFEYREKNFYESKVIFSDSTLFSVFDFPFLEGDRTTALSDPSSVVITESMARKYFGYESAVGKQLRFNNTTDLTVTGIIEDLPVNTHLQFDFVIPMSNIAASGIFRNMRVLDSWATDWFWTYLVLDDQKSVADVTKAIDKLTDEKIPDEKREHQARFFLQALTDIHLNSDFDYNTDITENGSKANVYIFASVGLLVLLISAINFVNISIALASRRNKEIGISKVLGAVKSQLRRQFLMESILVALVSLVISFAALNLVLPVFGALLGRPLTIASNGDLWVLVGVGVFALLVGLASGMYPAVFVSSFEPQRVLKGVWKPGAAAGRFRKLLVAIQVAISIALVTATIVIFQQLNFLQNKPLGFDKEQVIMLNVRGTAIPNSYYALKNKLENHSSIESVSSVSEPIGREVQFMSFKVEGRSDDQFIKILNVTHDFVKTMGLQIVAGRDFSRDVITDSISGFVINEALARTYGWEDPIGKTISHAWPTAPQGKVIGVVKNFNFEPLQNEVEPLVMWFGRAYWYVTVRVKSTDVQRTLGFLASTWREFEPVKPFSFHFLDDEIQKVYDKEQRLKSIFLVFAALSILTAALGLFGLISFIAEQRLTEIGVRKVFGASVADVVRLMSQDYVMLVVMAFIVAAPVTFLLMNMWLESFAYRTEWTGAPFLIAFLLVMVIVVGTVMAKAITAARTNPVKVLRAE